MNLWQTSLSGGLFILAVIVIRAVALHHLPKKTFLVLWGLVLLRLLLPINISSPTSICTLFEHEIAVPGPSITDKLSDQPEPDAVLTIDRFLPKQAGASSRFFGFETAQTTVWAVGAAIMATFFLLSYIFYRREFAMSLPVANDTVKRWLSGHPSQRRISVRQSDRISAPLTYGITHPVILMPKNTDWNDIEHLQYIFEHEYVHIRHFDLAIKPVVVAALCIHWFNPMVWIMYLLFNRDMELACDESVVRRFGELSRAAYSLVLIDMEEKHSGLQPFYSNFSKNAIEERITSIMKTKKLTVCSIVLACAIVAGATAVFATSAPTPTAIPETGTVYLLGWMKPHSIVLYDENLNRTIVQGGELDADDLKTMDYLTPEMIYPGSGTELLAEPNTKVEYDLHGELQNIYYLIPGTANDYAMDPNTRLYD